MTWVNTPPKFTEDKEELAEGEEEPAEEEEEEASEGDSSDEGKEEEEVVEEEEEAEKIEKLKVKYFKETDFHLRVPHADFEYLKTLETLAMSSVNTQPKLKVHVMCSGIRYGNGERIFYDHFQKAWIQNPAELQVVGNGRNRVPTIHIIDLARIVRRVVNEGSDLKYIFAMDKTKRPTQKRIIKSISKGVGTDKMKKY
jgi:adenylate kinase